MPSGNNTPSTNPKALPPPNKDDDLPPPPPSPSTSSAALPPPPPPPKITLDRLPDIPLESAGFREGLLSAPSSPLRETLVPPDVVSSPDSPSSPSGASAMLGPPSPTTDSSKAKKVNPFVDLLETEKVYVETLSGIIRKVASAWSRSNLPPPELDSMFRAVEAVFKADRSFLSKLKEIGPNPSSPRAIGDLLMKWIENLDTPYTNYCSQYLTGFDTWEPVQSNPRLPSVLETFSASNPPPTTGPPRWTLDGLFSLPRARVKYYQKLYGRLLKSSAPGKSTDKLLIEAVGRLEQLMNLADERANISLPDSSQTIETTDEVVIDTRAAEEKKLVPEGIEKPARADSLDSRAQSEETVRPAEERTVRSSAESSARTSSLSSGPRSSRDTAPTSDGRSSVATLSTSMFDLERRLATDRCRDLFTMNPRSVRLSINSPNLPYTRELRLSEDAVVHFTPKSASVGIIHRQGHIFLLTDLFLVCERMTPEDRAHCESESADMWLCYPPLAAKHLKAVPLDGDGLEITILKKEVMILRLDAAKRDAVLKEFGATASLAAALPPPSKQPPPPLPNLNGLHRPPNDNVILDRRPSASAESGGPSKSVIASPRAMSPVSGDPSMHRIDPIRNLSNGVGAPFPGPASRTPSLREPGPSGPPPYSPSRDQMPGVPQRLGPSPGPPGPPGNGPMSFGPGQIIPPPRGESNRSPAPPNGFVPGMGLPARPGMNGPPPSFGPGQVMPPPRGESTRLPPGVNGANGFPPQIGHVGPARSGSMPPRPFMNGPGPFPPGPPGMHGPAPGQMLPRQASLQGNGPPPRQQGPMPGQQMPPQAGPPYGNVARTPSDPSFLGAVRKSPSTRSLGQEFDRQQPPQSAPPVPSLPGGFPRGPPMFPMQGEGGNHLRPMLPSAALPRIVSSAPGFTVEPSPPPSPTEMIPPAGPQQSAVLATMKCKVFLQQQHAQWKSLGGAKLTLFEQRPSMVKQLVVEADNKDKTMLISTIVLTDGVERVGKTGVAIELSDKGARTGIIYMIQLRNEKSAGGLYDSLLAGSDRAT